VSEPGARILDVLEGTAGRTIFYKSDSEEAGSVNFQIKTNDLALPAVVDLDGYFYEYSHYLASGFFLAGLRDDPSNKAWLVLYR
jgi:hypothetical protein